MGNDTTKPVAEMSDGELLKASCEIVTELVPDGCGASYNRWQPDPARIRALVAAERRDEREKCADICRQRAQVLCREFEKPLQNIALGLAAAIRERGGENGGENER